MMISFIVILSLVARAISSSLSVQGSLSRTDDDTVSIDLFANKSNDGVDELVRKLYRTKRIRLTIDLAGKIISTQQAMLEINDGIDRYQNYLLTFLNEITTLVNIAEPKVISHAMYNLRKLDAINANVVRTALREISCEILHNDFVRSIISRTCSVNLTSTDDESKRNIDKNLTESQIASKIETRILGHSTLTDTGGNNSKRSPAASKIHPIDRERKINESAVIKRNFTNDNSVFLTSRDENLSFKTGSMDRETVLEQRNFKKKTFNDNLFSMKLVHLEAFQENVTSVPKIFSRRTFQLPWNVSSSKNRQEQPYVSGTKVNKISMMDEILEAVHQVLPTKESAKMPSKESKVMFGMS